VCKGTPLFCWGLGKQAQQAAGCMCVVCTSLLQNVVYMAGTPKAILAPPARLAAAGLAAAGLAAGKPGIVIVFL
jgi:hypothetical protein